MNKKSLTLTVLIVFMFIISGCQLTNFSASGKEAPITNVNVYQGTDGLEIEFLKDSPPDKVYEEQSFQVSTKLKNKGAYKINNGKVILTHEPDYVSVSTTTFPISNLEGKSMYDPTEHDVLKNFYLTTEQLESKSIEHDSIILVTACYDYGTKLSTELCIDTDPQNIKIIDKPCQMTDLSFSGQGAPISVSRVETKMLVFDEGRKIRPQFWIYIRNEGEGQVILRSSIDKACGSSNINKDETNGVILKDLKFSEYTLDDVDCKPNPSNARNPVLKLIGNEQYFVCTLKDDKALLTEDASTFKTNLFIELEYAYTITKSKQFKIKKYNT